MGMMDVAFVKWAPCALGAGVVVVMGDGSAFWVVPRFDADGGWGGLLGDWRCVQLFRQQGGFLKYLRLEDHEWRGTGEEFLDGDEVNMEDSKEGGGMVEKPARRKRRLTGELNCPLVSYFPAVQVLSVAFVRVVREGCALEADELHYVVFGRKDGAYLFEVSGGRHMEKLSNPLLALHTGWSAVVESLPAVRVGGKCMTLVAVGGAFGQLCVYSVWLDSNEEDLVLRSKLLWKAESSLLFGAVASLSWSFGDSFQKDVRLAVASGETVAIANWTNVEGGEGEQFGASPEFHRIGEAHKKLVSSVQVLFDGSVVSSAVDGEMYIWKLSDGADGGDGKERKISCSRIEKGAGVAESVMTMQRSMNGLGVVLLMSTSRTRAEVQEEEEEAKNKYGAGARRTIISLCIQPPGCGGIEGAKRYLFSVIDALISNPRYIGQPIKLWDMELFIEQFEPTEEEELLKAFSGRFYDMLENVKQRKLPNCSERVFQHYLRVAHALSQLVRHIGGAKLGATDLLEQTSTDVSNAVRTFHYDACLTSFLTMSEKALSKEECRALECMCQFVSITKRELLWNSAETYSRMGNVREQLAQRGEGADALMMPCAICASEMFVPLVSDASDATSFYCAKGDSYSRCVLTGLPVTDVVPLVCYGCDAKAVAEGFDPFGQKGGKFGWIVDVGRCALCLCMLLPSSVEIQ